MADTAQLIEPELLLRAYTMGLFPMAPAADSADVHWYEPRKRGIIPLERFRVSKNLKRWLRNTPHEVRYSTCFQDVVAACARTREETWISPVIEASYLELHKLGFAHSVEVFQAGELVGGCYGVALRGLFAGESMFQTRPEMHKVALFYCHQRLVEGGFHLWDTQYYTPHLGRFGAQEITQRDYLGLLAEALRYPAQFLPQQESP